MNPTPIEELSARVPPFPVPVGYAASPLPAVWFYDSAANITGRHRLPVRGDRGAVDAYGEVTRFQHGTGR